MIGKNPSNLDIQNCIKNLEATVNESLAKMAQSVDSLKAQLAAKNLIVDQLSKESMSQGKEINELKFQLNEIQQGERGGSLRVMGRDIPPEDIAALGPSKAIMKRVYDRLLKPVFAAAKAKNAIVAVPKMDTALASAYIAGKPYKDPQGRTLPAPLIVKFNNWDLRNVVLKHKKESLPNPMDAEKAAGVKRFLLAEDLTKANLEIFKRLIADSRVGPVWTINGCARFVLVDDANKKVLKVPSPFMSVDEIIDRCKQS